VPTRTRCELTTTSANRVHARALLLNCQAFAFAKSIKERLMRRRIGGFCVEQTKSPAAAGDCTFARLSL
jgi:hypothetical protein